MEQQDVLLVALSPISIHSLAREGDRGQRFQLQVKEAKLLSFPGTELLWYLFTAHPPLLLPPSFFPRSRRKARK